MRRCRKIGVGERKAERPVIASANRGGGGVGGESFVGIAREGEAGGMGGIETVCRMVGITECIEGFFKVENSIKNPLELQNMFGIFCYQNMYLEI